MFAVSGGGALGNIGQRNIESVHMCLKRESIPILKEDVGGGSARTLLFDVSSGMGCVRCYGQTRTYYLTMGSEKSVTDMLEDNKKGILLESGTNEIEVMASLPLMGTCMGSMSRK